MFTLPLFCCCGIWSTVSMGEDLLRYIYSGTFPEYSSNDDARHRDLFEDRERVLLLSLALAQHPVKKIQAGGQVLRQQRAGRGVRRGFVQNFDPRARMCLDFGVTIKMKQEVLVNSLSTDNVQRRTFVLPSYRSLLVLSYLLYHERPQTCTCSDMKELSQLLRQQRFQSRTNFPKIDEKKFAVASDAAGQTTWSCQNLKSTKNTG